MKRFGHTVMSRQSGPNEPVEYAVGDETQERFLDEAAGPLLDTLRAAAS